MHFLILLGLMIAFSVISALLSKPKAPGLTIVSPPTTSPGTPIPVLFGRAKIAGNVIWFGGFKVHPINEYADFGLVKVQIGRNYSISMAVALCVGPIDMWYDIIADTGQRFTEMTRYPLITGYIGDVFSGFTPSTSLQNVITLDHGTMPFDVSSDLAHGGDGVVLANIYNPNLYGGKFGQSGVTGPIRFYAGRRNQPANAYWGAFPLASIPGISYSIDAGGVVTINVFFRRDITSIRYAVSTVAAPSDGDVLGGTLISAAPWTFTFSALTSGQTLFVGILGFNAGGTPSPLASFSITWSGSPQTGEPVATGSAGSTEPAPPYPNLSYAVFEDTMIGQSVYPRPLYFEVGRTPAPGFTTFPSNVAGDVNPISIIYELLTDPFWGVGLTTDDIDVAALSGAAAAVGDTDQLYVSYLLSQQQPAQEVIDEILRTIDAVRYTDPLTGKLGIKLIRADYNVALLGTFDNSNIGSLDFTQAGWRETVNEVKVSFTDRARDYQTNQVAAQDLAGIMATGRVATRSVSYPGVTSEDLALRLAQRDLRSLALPLAKATMKVNREAFDLHEGSPFLLSYADYGVSQLVMRVMTIARAGRDDGELTVECVQDTFSLPETPAYATSGVTWDDPVGPGAIQVPEVTPVTGQDATTGALALQIDDPDARVTMVQFQHQSGNGAMTALATATAPYHDQVTLDPRYPSTINWVVTYATPDGSIDTITGTASFSIKQAPETPDLSGSVDASGNVTVVATASPDTNGIKFASSTTGYPSAATVRAATLDTTQPFTYAPAPITAGQTLFVAAFAYDSAGNESPSLGMVAVPFGGGSSGINWRGAWSSATAYAINDAVSFNGSSYIAIATNTNQQPDTHPADWNVLASEGGTGATGSTGPAGPAGPSGPWGQDAATTTGLTYGYFGGELINSTGGFTHIADGTIALANNATNFVERDESGTVSTNTSSFTAGKIPMAKVTTVGGAITTVEDDRMHALADRATVLARTVTYTTASLADGATETGTIAIPSGAREADLEALQTDHTAWVRCYATSAARSADSGRPITSDPIPGNGVLADFLPLGTTVPCGPPVGLYNGDTPQGNNIYIAITNKSGGATTITATFTLRPY